MKSRKEIYEIIQSLNEGLIYDNLQKSKTPTKWLINYYRKQLKDYKSTKEEIKEILMQVNHVVKEFKMKEEIEATNRKEEAKKKTKEVLLKVIDCIDKEDWKTLRSMIEYSPAGDCMGCENYFISFGEYSKGYYSDIGDMYRAMSGESLED